MKSEFSHMKIFYKDYMHFASRSRIMLEMVIVDAAILAFIAYRISQISNLKALWPNGTAFSATFAGFAYFFVCWTATFMGSFAISNDFTTNSGQYILSLPVKRSSIFIGRYLAATTLAAMAVLSFFYFWLQNPILTLKLYPSHLLKAILYPCL
ncbi:ABC-2 transporter permease [Acidiplasma cupricumulans]|uniref:ABC-2 transporter permease n=1 Tax=Acidiplasma cupricumulans TaxID=312540 RepID=UPI000785DD5A|nr:ABC-2 transporter permease [Acidiplasma cupricumulans]